MAIQAVDGRYAVDGITRVRALHAAARAHRARSTRAGRRPGT